MSEDRSISPVWVLGMFRSGTSLTSNILIELGLDFGPVNHQLQPVGKLKHLNPNGFFENYIFAEYSRYFLYKLGGKGDDIPSEKELKSISFEEVQIPKLFEYSLFTINDDRITLENKLDSMKILATNGVNSYMRSSFSGRPCVKIPMLSFFYPQINKIWPNSYFLVVFRNPISTLKSSNVLTKSNSYDLYNDYYKFLLKTPEVSNNCIFFSYDHLLENPEHSITQLSQYLDLNKNKLQESISLIKKELIRNIPDKEIEDQECKNTYSELLSLAINVDK